jgi:hypothetical protein
MNHIAEYDNIIQQEHQDAIEKSIGGKKFPWNYKIGATHSDGVDNIYGFVKVLYFKFNSDIPDQKYINLLSPLLRSAIAKYDSAANLKDVFRIRAGLFTKNQNDGRDHLPHIDFTLKHHTMIYYVNDSDGPTSLFDDNKKLIYTCHPKKGRCLIFPGETYHSSAEPKLYPHRIAITFNFLL